MARNLSRYEAAARKLFGVKGEVVAPGLSSEILLAATLEPGNESHCYLRRERPVAATVYQAAVAGEYSYVNIGPSSDTHLMIVKQVSVYCSAQMRIALALTNPYAAAGTNGVFVSRDTRSMATTLPYPHPTVSQVSYASSVGALTANLWKLAPTAANVDAIMRVPVVLSHDWMLQVGAQTVNTAMYVSVEALEVPIVPQEQ